MSQDTSSGCPPDELGRGDPEASPPTHADHNCQPTDSSAPFFPSPNSDLQSPYPPTPIPRFMALPPKFGVLSRQPRAQPNSFLTLRGHTRRGRTCLIHRLTPHHFHLCPSNRRRRSCRSRRKKFRRHPNRTGRPPRTNPRPHHSSLCARTLFRQSTLGRIGISRATAPSGC